MAAEAGTHAVVLHPPAGPLRGTIALPGSKSITNRALIMAALAEGESVLENASPSDDSAVLAEALARLDVASAWNGSELRVAGCGGRFAPYHGELHVGAAGTAMRFLTCLACVVPGGAIRLGGTARMHERPIGPLVDALRSLGADIRCAEREGFPPLVIKGAEGYAGGRTSMPGGLSSQYFTALLLIAPLLAHGLELEVEGVQASPSYIDMTIAAMREFGVEVVNEGYRRYRVAPGQRYQARRVRIEGDASGASYFWGAAALSAGHVRVCNIHADSAQGDARFVQLLAEMGCRVETGVDGGVPWIAVQGCRELSGIAADMTSMPDTAQTLAVIAACARGQSRISGLGTLRIKETDRIAAVCSELARAGILANPSGDDALEIRGGTPRGARIKTYDDHRMAMAFAMLGCRVPGITIEDPQVVRKSFPSFWDLFTSLGVGVE